MFQCPTCPRRLNSRFQLLQHHARCGQKVDLRMIQQFMTQKCPSFEKKGTCGRGDMCTFAHGSAEVRTVAAPVEGKTRVRSDQPASRGRGAAGQPAQRGRGAAGQPARGRGAAGQPAQRGRGAAGQPARGRGAAGQPAQRGRGAAGQPARGRGAAGQPARGRGAAGQPARGRGAAAQPASRGRGAAGQRGRGAATQPASQSGSQQGAMRRDGVAACLVCGKPMNEDLVVAHVKKRHLGGAAGQAWRKKGQSALQHLGHVDGDREQLTREAAAQLRAMAIAFAPAGMRDRPMEPLPDNFGQSNLRRALPMVVAELEAQLLSGFWKACESSRYGLRVSSRGGVLRVERLLPTTAVWVLPDEEGSPGFVALLDQSAKKNHWALRTADGRKFKKGFRARAWNIGATQPLERVCAAVLASRTNIERFLGPVRALPQPAGSSGRDDLNPEQDEAMRLVLGADKNVLLLRGPPGTGKTYTLVRIIQGITAKYPEARVLVCAPSNAATQVVATAFKQLSGRCAMVLCAADERVPDDSELRELLVDNKFKLEWSCLGKWRKRCGADKSLRPDTVDRIKNDLTCVAERMGDWTRNMPGTEELAKLVHDARALLAADDVKAAWGQLHDALNRHEEDFRASSVWRAAVVDARSVVFSTLSTSGRTSMFAKPFDYLLIDEACQTVEAETWVPLPLVARGGSVVLVGDPRQLPATTFWEHATECKYGRPWFNRLVETDAPDHMLKEQHRMDERISAFPNKTYYEGKLRNAAVVLSRSPPPWRERPGYGPLNFVNVNGAEARQGSSFVNLAEAEVVRDCLRQLLRMGADGSTIGVVSPYRAQTELLRDDDESEFSGVQFSTVDGFQGAEKDVIILTLVRSRAVGFCADERRLNVAITRARSTLIVIANAEFFTKAGDATDVAALCRHCKDTGAYFGDAGVLRHTQQSRGPTRAPYAPAAAATAASRKGGK
eukprot:TRINITY_DN7630_c0_g1_i4.p1 TRINITY_DN7630_c0_g1~~TRINITY_DN7630_c0_g1_i4.p1  ORF type:complete len:955 (+),score=165.47 TRINITY_DN7630_c0_g1_i4:82-2946(+)